MAFNIEKKISEKYEISIKQKPIFFDVNITSEMFGFKRINKKLEHLEIRKLKLLGFGTLGQLALIGLYLNGFLYKNQKNPVASFFNGNENIGLDRLEMAKLVREQIINEGVDEKKLDEILRIACKLVYCKNNENKKIQLQESFYFGPEKQIYIKAINHIENNIKMIEDSDKNPIVCCDLIGLMPIFKLKELSLYLLINFGLIEEVSLFETKCNQMIKKQKRKNDKNIYALVEKKEVIEFLEGIIEIFKQKAGIKSQKLTDEIKKNTDSIIKK